MTNLAQRFCYVHCMFCLLCALCTLHKMYITHARCVMYAWHTTRTMSMLCILCMLCILSKSACYACCSPDKVISSPAACSSLPTKALASLNATESMGPEGGTPMCHSFVRPGQSCRLTCGVLLYNLVMACMSCCDCLCSNADLDCRVHANVNDLRPFCVWHHRNTFNMTLTVCWPPVGPKDYKCK